MSSLLEYSWFIMLCYFLLYRKVTQLYINSDQSLSRVRLFVTSWIAARQAPCPSPTPGVHSNSCLLSQWCHPTISSSVIPFSSCLQSFPASGSFPMNQFFASGGQGIGVSFQHQSFQWTFRIDLLQDGLVGYPCSPRDSRVFSNITVQKHKFFGSQLSL